MSCRLLPARELEWDLLGAIEDPFFARSTLREALENDHIPHILNLSEYVREHTGFPWPPHYEDQREALYEHIGRELDLGNAVLVMTGAMPPLRPALVWQADRTQPGGGSWVPGTVQVEDCHRRLAFRARNLQQWRHGRQAVPQKDSAGQVENPGTAATPLSEPVKPTGTPKPKADPGKQKDAQRLNRLKIYAKAIYGIQPSDFTIAKFKAAARKQLGIDDPKKLVPMKEREKNFMAFAKKFIHVERPPTAEEMAQYRKELKEFGPELAERPVSRYIKRLDTSMAMYGKLREYAMTDYGAIVIARLLKSPPEGFGVYIGNSGTAGGASNMVIFPPNFPRMDYFPGGEEMDYLAVIHHEFGHTNLYKAKNYDGKTLLSERNVVVGLDNPVRILNGKEPRYTYFESNNGGQTINIINPSRTADGRMTFDPKDPSILKARTPEQARTWGVFVR